MVNGKMKLIFLLAIGLAGDAEKAPVSDPEPIEEPEPSDEVEECQKGVKDLRKDVLGLEFFLQDKKDHKNYCPYTKWEQPKLDEYKKDPKSYLPKECKAEKI